MAAPHGHTKLFWLDNLLQTEAFGPFNEDAAVIALEKLKSTTLERCHEFSFWQRIDILDFETMGSPKVMGMIGYSYIWCFEQGCHAIATVYSNQLQKSLLSRFTEESKTNMKGFDNRHDADEWLKEQHSVYLNQTGTN